MNSNQLFRVSEILEPYKKSYAIPGSIAEEMYFLRGTKVHEWCAAYAKSIWMPISLDEYKGYCESFRNWFDKYVVKVFFVEQEFKDEDLGFSGRPDIGCLLRGENEGILPDYKTSATTQRWWQGQGAAYLHLAQKAGYPVTRAGSLKLKADGGTAKFIPCDIPAEAFAAFLSALNAHRYFK
jgi:hypothetical protein